MSLAIQGSKGLVPTTYLKDSRCNQHIVLRMHSKFSVSQDHHPSRIWAPAEDRQKGIQNLFAVGGIRALHIDITYYAAVEKKELN